MSRKFSEQYSRVWSRSNNIASQQAKPSPDGSYSTVVGAVLYEATLKATV
jgi:hypothetical protein